MAALLSRRCLGTLGLQQGSGLAFVDSSHLSFSVRGYAAAATATKQKPKAATPAATKTAPTKKSVSPAVTPKKPALARSAPKAAAPPTKKTAAPPTPKAATTPTPKAAPPTKKPAAPPTKKAASSTPKPTAKKPAVQSTSTKTGTPSQKVDNIKLLRKANQAVVMKVNKDKEEMTEEEQLAQLEQIMNIGRLHPTRDPWGMAVETLDVMIPYSVSFSQRSSYSSWREMYEQFKRNCHNTMKNYTSMTTLASENAIPGIDLSGTRWWRKYLTQWPWRLASTTSVKEGSWLTSLRKSVLSSYCQLNTALAKRDDREIKELTSSVYQDQVLRLRKKQTPTYTYRWHFHKEVTPARVLSIRATPGYLANEPPKFGNRMMVHALVRIDTEQSLEIYTHQGIPMHNRAPKGVKSGSSAQPVRVTEYLVFEKRMWYDGPWIIREQLWESPGMKAAV